MEVLSALGLNETVVIQFVLFIFVFGFVYGLLFKPYFSAFLKRTERTVGNTEAAEKIGQEVRSLEDRYVALAREANQKMKSAFDKIRNEAAQEHDAIIRQTRDQTRRELEQVQLAAKSQLDRSQAEMKSEATGLSGGIVQKLLGKDLAT